MDRQLSGLGTVHPLSHQTSLAHGFIRFMLCFNVEEEVVVIRNGWTANKKEEFGVASRDHDSWTFLASILRSNQSKLNSSLPAWRVASPTFSYVSSMSPTHSVRSLVHRKLSLGDASTAIRVIASDDTVLDITPEVLRVLRHKKPDALADADFSTFPTDINDFSVSVNDLAKVLGNFALDSCGGIDCLQPAQFFDLTLNSTAEVESDPLLLLCILSFCLKGWFCSRNTSLAQQL